MQSLASPYALLGAALAGALVVSAQLYGAFSPPPPVMDLPVFCDGASREIRPGESLRVLIWNIQYGASTKHQFFYDGGEAVRVERADVDWTLDQIVQTVQELNPDLVLWQEIDVGSDRTARVDQLAELTRRLDHRCYASASYHRVPYVPHPSHEPMGRVDMRLAVSGNLRLTDARRHQLALLDEPWWRRLFNLRRALLDVRVPIQDGRTLRLLNTHLSAFSFGDGTLPMQLGQIRDLAEQGVRDGEAVLLAGDLNALPPGDDPARFTGQDRELYADVGSPIAALYDSPYLKPSVPPERVARNPRPYYTYVPFEGEPDRMIDHAFVGGPVQVLSHKVWQDRKDISDHFPILLKLRVGP
ncbi:MAG: hypothetical protein EA397_04710 [Deltaproteobacteria bacterium]|nr:MAG: hypothetical protein EA397_04710 [Deltaproteobacteria bacterium]